MGRIATRILEEAGTGHRVVVSLDAPIEASDGVWECRYSIVGLEGTQSKTGLGSDSFQAIMIALELIRVTLRDNGKSLSWLGLEPGLTGFSRVHFAFGKAVVDRIENLIDQEFEQASCEAVAAKHPEPKKE